MGREIREISRPEAGELVVDARRESYRGRTFPVLNSAAGRSVDGLTEIVLPNRSISSGGFLGYFSRVAVADVLISWWPVNRRSRAGL